MLQKPRRKIQWSDVYFCAKKSAVHAYLFPQKDLFLLFEFSINWFTSQVAAKDKTGPGWSEESETSSGFPTWVTGAPRTCTIFPGTIRGAGLEMDRPGLQFMWDVNLVGSDLANYNTMKAPLSSLHTYFHKLFEEFVESTISEVFLD